MLKKNYVLPIAAEKTGFRDYFAILQKVSPFQTLRLSLCKRVNNFFGTFFVVILKRNNFCFDKFYVKPIIMEIRDKNENSKLQTFLRVGEGEGGRHTGRGGKNFGYSTPVGEYYR